MEFPTKSKEMKIPNYPPFFTLLGFVSCLWSSYPKQNGVFRVMFLWSQIVETRRRRVGQEKLGFSVGMEAFDELLSINVPWSQEFPGVRVWT